MSATTDHSAGRKLASARDLALTMAENWQIDPSPMLLGPKDGVSAVFLDAMPAEVTSEQSDAHILSLVVKGEQRHRRFLDGRQMHDGFLPDRSVNIVVAGLRPRAVIEERIQVLHVYLPHAHLVRRARQAGFGGHAGGLEIIDPWCAPDVELGHLLSVLQSAVRAGEPLDLLYAESLSAAVAARVLARWSNLAGLPAFAEHPVKGGLAPWRLRRATELLQADFSADLTLDELATEVGLSPFHLCRVFKEATGMPPHRWRYQRRMAHARELLAQTTLPVSEIAASVGYSEPSQLAVAFRRSFGISPTRYRAEYRS